MKEQTPIGYLFNGRFYKSIDELRGRTMSEDNKPQPLFTESQCKEKVLEALERDIPNFMRWCDEGANIEVDNSDFEAFKEIAENYIETEVKPKYVSTK